MSEAVRRYVGEGVLLYPLGGHSPPPAKWGVQLHLVHLLIETFGTWPTEN